MKTDRFGIDGLHPPRHSPRDDRVVDDIVPGKLHDRRLPFLQPARKLIREIEERDLVFPCNEVESP